MQQQLTMDVQKLMITIQRDIILCFAALNRLEVLFTTTGTP
jgi:hypothetical protein